jgi:hypothetical protein
LGTETLYSIILHFISLPALGNHHSTFCFYEFHYSKLLLGVELFSIYPIKTGLFHLTLSSWFTHVVAYDRIYFLLKVEQYSIACLQLISSVNEHLCCFHFLSAMNNVVVNTAIQISVWVLTFISFGYILRSGIAGSDDNSIFFEEHWSP